MAYIFVRWSRVLIKLIDLSLGRPGNTQVIRSAPSVTHPATGIFVARTRLCHRQLSCWVIVMQITYMPDWLLTRISVVKRFCHMGRAAQAVWVVRIALLKTPLSRTHLQSNWLF